MGWYKEWILKNQLKKKKQAETEARIKAECEKSDKETKYLKAFNEYKILSKIDVNKEKFIETLKIDLNNFNRWKETKPKTEKKQGMLDKLFAPKNVITAVFFMRDHSIEFVDADATRNIFQFRDRMYIIDTTKVYQVQSMKTAASFYIEDIATPLDFNESVTRLLDEIKDNNINSEVTLGLDSKVFERFIKSEFVQKLMAGGEMLNDMMFLKIVGIVLGILIFLNFIVSVIGLFIHR